MRERGSCGDGGTVMFVVVVASVLCGLCVIMGIKLLLRNNKIQDVFVQLDNTFA